MKKSINIHTELFIITQNDLNNNHMVHSKHPNLLDCYSFKYKRDAKECMNNLNKQVLKDANKHNFEIIS